MYLVFQYAEAKQAQLETNLFEVEASVKSEEVSEGQNLIFEFLKKCKQVQESDNSDETMMKSIEELKQDLLKHNNKYILSIMAH